MNARALLLAAVTGWGLLYIWRTSFVLGGARVFVLWDDAMISLRYARNLVDGAGLVWNAGERVQGISNPGVTLVLALVHALPVSELHVSLLFQLVCLALLVAIVALALRLARELAPEPPLLPLLAAASVALYAPLAVWSLQGSDVAPVTAVVLGALVLSARTLRERRGLARASWALLALGVVLRPDTAVPFAACIGFALLEGRAAWRSAALGAALLGATLAALLAFGALYYGDPLPNTFHLKATGAPLADVLANGAGQLREMSSPLSLPLLALTLAGIWLLRGDPLVRISALVVASLFAYDVGVGGDWLKAWHSRFVVPAVTLYCVLHAAAARAVLARLLPAQRLDAAGGRVLLAGFALLGAFAFLSPAALREWLWPPAPTLWAQENRENARIAFYLRRNTPPDTSIALHCAGTTGYFAQRPAIDVLGKSDRHIARLPVRVFHPGHSKWDWDYVLHERRPDVITETSRGLDNHPELARRYYLARTSGGLQFHVRKDALAGLGDHDVTLYAFRARKGMSWQEAVARAADEEASR